MSNTFSEFRQGLRDSMPIIVAMLPFGGMYGATAAEKALSTFDGMLLSALVFAGGSQFIALQFWTDPLPLMTIAIVVFAVNFRHVLYGASLSRKLYNFKPWQKYVSFAFMTDVAFALSEARHEKTAGKSDVNGVTFAYYVGAFALLYPLWVLVSFLGLYFGRLIDDPTKYGLDFMLPIYFLGLLMGFRHKANWFWIVITSSTVSFIALKFVGSPWHITIGSLAGVVLGAFFGPQRKITEKASA